MEKIDAPKLFISYSWSSPNHEQRVLELGTELRNNGVDVILDKWDLKEGQDAIVFMEKMVTDSLIKKVIMICDKKYVEKTDNRRGGVGTEAQIISKEIYDKVDQNKFVALVVEKDELGNAYLPVYYKSRKYIDLSSDSDYSKNFEQLLRWIFDKPFYEKPEIGKPPVFLESDNSISLNTSFIYKRLIESIRNQKENQYGLLKEYFNVFIKNFINFYIEYKDMNTFDDLLIENINSIFQ